MVNMFSMVLVRWWGKFGCNGFTIVWVSYEHEKTRHTCPERHIITSTSKLIVL